MIDFRYHIVSLVAVFLALAVGIVIGAFTLSGGVGDSLNHQASSLRSEQAQLRAQVQATGNALNRADNFATLADPALIDGVLSGDSIALVLLPGTPDSLLSATKSSIASAGGSVATTVTLSDSWLKAQSAERLRAVATTVGVEPAQTDASRLPGIVLGKAVMGRDTAAGKAALEKLQSESLIDIDGTAAGKPTSIVVLWPGLPATTDQQTVTGWTGSIAGIGASTTAVVGVSSGPADNDLTNPDPLVTSLRGSADATATMSVVDDGGRAMGQTAVVLATQKELAGVSGQYGLGADATGPIPAITGAR
ncbi:copper transport outer membrane protein MctB [Branchiibius hedensis]|uniref:Copper transport outer membrane protein, MctB n=1 Tax=Branchiibius hedensis TaxID=672460 RepID=A0A2Y9C1E6_9MICO|nr:copper transporter [Branchiibius hedensis]PWJ25380.1 copper transport outer membrane protein MctB [Branchiibius hedensis]SSA34193.1 Copper transport outer membrane protein, MctB [Branchiibius hedensis]